MKQVAKVGDLVEMKTPADKGSGLFGIVLSEKTYPTSLKLQPRRELVVCLPWGPTEIGDQHVIIRSAS